MKNNRVVVVSGPGGVGKGTVVAALREQRPDIAVSVSATTRAPRKGEVDGVHYHFFSDEAFDTAVQAGNFFEWAEFNGNRYGTLNQSIVDVEGTVVLEIDVQGAEQVLARREELNRFEIITVFLAPPSWDELERRLRGRGTDDEGTITSRIRIGHEEMETAPLFDFTVVNTTVAEAVDQLGHILDEP